MELVPKKCLIEIEYQIYQEMKRLLPDGVTEFVGANDLGFAKDPTFLSIIFH